MATYSKLMGEVYYSLYTRLFKDFPEWAEQEEKEEKTVSDTLHMVATANLLGQEAGTAFKRREDVAKNNGYKPESLPFAIFLDNLLGKTTRLALTNSLAVLTRKEDSFDLLFLPSTGKQKVGLYVVDSMGRRATLAGDKRAAVLQSTPVFLHLADSIFSRGKPSELAEPVTFPVQKLLALEGKEHAYSLTRAETAAKLATDLATVWAGVYGCVDPDGKYSYTALTVFGYDFGNDSITLMSPYIAAVARRAAWVEKKREKKEVEGHPKKEVKKVPWYTSGVKSELASARDKPAAACVLYIVRRVKERGESHADSKGSRTYTTSVTASELMESVPEIADMLATANQKNFIRDLSRHLRNAEKYLLLYTNFPDIYKNFRVDFFPPSARRLDRPCIVVSHKGHTRNFT